MAHLAMEPNLRELPHPGVHSQEYSLRAVTFQGMLWVCNPWRDEVRELFGPGRFVGVNRSWAARAGRLDLTSGFRKEKEQTC